MSIQDCTICGESHADHECDTKFCSACWDMIWFKDGTCDGCADPTPVSAAEWIDAGRPEKRKPKRRTYECDHGRVGSCRQCDDEARGDWLRECADDDRMLAGVR